MSQNIEINPPAAAAQFGNTFGLPPQEPVDEITLLRAEVAGLRSQTKQLQVMASTITVAACSLVRVLTDGDTAVVPRDVWQRMHDGQINVQETTEGNIQVTLTERADDLITFG